MIARFLCFSLAAVTASLSPLCHGADFAALSPNHEVALTFSVGADGIPHYRITHHGQPVVLDSRLGLAGIAPSPNLLDGFVVVHSRTQHRNFTWKPVYGERAVIPDNFSEVVVELRHSRAGTRVNLIGRAYDEGAAFRYEFPAEAGAAPLTLGERSEFVFPEKTYGFEEHGTEGEYARVLIPAIKKDCERPLTLEYSDGRFASLVEADLDRYPRMLLSPAPGALGALVSALSGPASIDLKKGGTTPWRAFIVGDKPGDLLERNYLVLNLNPACALADTSWIKPGKAIREVSLSTPGGKACIDFAVAHGFRYILYDAGWYGEENDPAADARSVHLDQKRVGRVPNHPGLNLAEVIAYGKQRGIGVFLYVNRRALERQLGELLPLYESWGVAGVKFGFVQVGAQPWTTWLLDAVRQAAAHHLLVDIHDNYRPTGFTRTYPNLLTQEGVRGNEHMPTATHNATLPFTRLPAGPADYTICIYDQRLKTTRAQQLALAVTGYSPLQLLYWYDRPAQFDGAPELAFLDRVPTTWDDTRVVGGEIGTFATIARRSGDDWFVGSITGDAPGGRDLGVPLSFLTAGRKYTAHIYENDPTAPRATRVRTETVERATVVHTHLPAAGGQSIWLTPLRP
jgi:alpha-glucosidase